MGDSYHGGLWKRGDRKTVDRSREQRTPAAPTAQETGQAQGMRTTLVERVINSHNYRLRLKNKQKTASTTTKQSYKERQEGGLISLRVSDSVRAVNQSGSLKSSRCGHLT